MWTTALDFRRADFNLFRDMTIKVINEDRY